MVRTQVQLTEIQSANLRRLSTERNQSMAELIRISIDQFVEQQSNGGRAAIVARAKAAVGRFSSGSADGSSDHDRHLAEAFAATE